MQILEYITIGHDHLISNNFLFVVQIYLTPFRSTLHDLNCW
jgi:hypothetical protein